MNDDTKKFIDSLKSKWVGAKGLSQLIHDINERFITKVDATTALNTKVTKVPGKDLSDENYTAFEKNKLDGVESGAQINVLEKVKVNGKLQANADKTVDIFVPTDDNQIANSADYQNGKQVAASIKVETDARTAADNSLLVEISNEANTRSEADAVLTEDLNTEVTARANADKTLQDNLDKETSARTSADSTLQSNIDKEASARSSADSTEATARANADKTLQDNLDSHTSNKSNPHGVTKSQVGLGSVANIDQSKAIKSITRSGTTFTATALDGTKTTFDQQDNNTTYSDATTSTHGLMSSTDKSKLDSVASTYATKSELSSHSQNASNPHKVTASQVGALPLLGGSLTGKLTVPSIETGDADANYFQTQKMRGEGGADVYYHAIDFGFAGHNQVDFYEYGGKYVFHQHKERDKSSGDAVIGEINSDGFVGKVNGHTINADVPAGAKFTDTTYSNATTSAAGLMSASDKSKLDGIAAGANTYTHPAYTAKSSGLYKVTVDGTGHVSAATAVTKADITALGIPGQDTNTTYSTMTGASTSADGSSGLVPAPAKGNANRYLRSDGTWSVPPDTNTTYGVASSSSNGLMSASDKSKLDGIAAGANKYTHPAYTAKSSGLYKVTVDGTGHVSAATAVTKADITALGIPGQDTNTTYSDATTSAHGLMSAADKSKLNGIASGATKNVSTVKSFTLSASSWSSGTYTISDSLITASSNQEVLPATTITAAQYNALSKAQIIDGGQSAGKLTLKALGTVPTIDIPIRVIFRGTI